MQEGPGRAARRVRAARPVLGNAVPDGAIKRESECCVQRRRSDFALGDSSVCGAARLYAFVIDDIKNDSVPCDEVTLSCRKQPILGER